jgi:hypothetical protein
MRDFLRRLTGEHREASDPHVAGAPFSRAELPALLGEQPGLAAFVAGTSDDVGPEFGSGPLAEAGVWLTFLGDQSRADAAFRAAADAALRDAQLGTEAGVAYARREPIPVRAAAEGGAFLALAGDARSATRIWQQMLAQYSPLAGADEADAAGAAQQTWAMWEARVQEIDRLGPAAERKPEDEPLDPSKLGYMSVYLAYGALRTNAVDAAARFLQREASLAAAVPGPQSRSYYRELLSFVGMLADILRGLEGALSGRRQPAPDKPVRAYVATRLPVALALVLDLQREFPSSMPSILPPADLTDALTGRALRRLNERGTKR